jgi:hypothetical protein
MDFHIGSGLAALTEVGNEAEDLHFYGGRYGILTDKTSPAWQFTLIDSVFEGQRDAAVREHEVGLTLIRDTFRNVPTPSISIRTIPTSCGSRTAASSRSRKPPSSSATRKALLPKIGFENAVLKDVPTFALFRESGKTVSPAKARSTRSQISTTGSSCPVRECPAQSACATMLRR